MDAKSALEGMTAIYNTVPPDERDVLDAALASHPFGIAGEAVATIAVAAEAEVVEPALGRPSRSGGAADIGTKGQPERVEQERFEYTVADAKAMVWEQLASTYTGYSNYVTDIGRLRSADNRPLSMPEAAVREQLDSALTEWEDIGGLDFVRRECTDDPELKFTLVTHQDPSFTTDEFESLMEGLANGKPHPSRADISDLFGRVTPEQLAGVMPKAPELRFFLIPNKPNLAPGTPREHRNMLAQTREEYPYLVIPPPAAALSYWYALQAKGDLPASANKQDFATIYSKTILRYPDIKILRAAHGSLLRAEHVLELFISSSGLPTSQFASDTTVHDGRLALGQKPYR